MDHHFQSNESKLTGQECITKLIMELWEHMDRLWMYRNNRYHENANQQVLRYKTEALDIRYDDMWEKHTGLVERLHAFQTKHFENRQQIGNINYENKRFWVNSAEQYINEASSPIRSEIYTLSELLGARNVMG
jgi:predicted  nucleic acid-binding Zn-ribbon protein